MAVPFLFLFFFLHLLVFNYSSKRHNKLNSKKVIAIACQQALRGALAAGRENEGDLVTTSLEFEFHLQSPMAPRRLSCLMSGNQREAETSTNLNKRWKTRTKSSDVISNVISANQHFESTF